MGRIVLLWWKDFLWIRRNVSSSVLQITFPILLSLAASYLLKMHNFSVKNELGSIMSHESFPSSNRYSTALNFTIFLRSTIESSVLDRLQNKFSSLSQQRGLTVEKDWHQIEDQVRLQKTNGIFIIEDWNVSKPELKYDIIVNNWFLSTNLLPTFGLWSQDQETSFNQMNTKYAAELQKYIEGYFIEEVQRENGKPSRSPFINSIHHSAMPLFNKPSHYVYVLLGQVATLSCIMTILQMATQIREERDSGVKNHMSTFGIARVHYFGAYMLLYSLKLFVVQIVFWTVPMFLTNINPAHLLPLIIVYSFVLSSFSLVMSVLCHTMSSARWGTLLVLAFLHLSQLYFHDLSPAPNRSILASLFFPTALYFYFRSLATQAMIGIDIGILSGFLEISSLLMLLLDALFMFLTAIYIDTIFPGNGTEGERWYSPFMRDYWQPIYGAPVYESECSAKPTCTVTNSLGSRIDVTQAELSASQANNTVGGKAEISTDTSIIMCQGVCKRVKENWAVNKVTLDVTKGEILVLYGPRGCGNKDLLDLMSGETTPDYGNVYMAHTKDRELSVAYHSCRPAFFNHMKLTEMMQWVTMARDSAIQENLTMLEELQLISFMDKRVSELNTTQRHLFNLVLAFVGKTDILLMEEPTHNCSQVLQKIMRNFIRKRKDERTIVVATYDPFEAEVLANKIGFFAMGHLLYLGTVSEIHERYMNASYIVAWPTNTEDNANEAPDGKIETALRKYLEDDNKIIDCEVMPNGTVHYRMPLLHGKKMPEIIGMLQRDSENLGIQHFEIVRESIHDAYRRCCPTEISSDTAKKVRDLYTMYGEYRTKNPFRIVAVLMKMRLIFWRHYVLRMVLSYILPCLALFFIYQTIFVYRMTEESICIGTNMLTRGLVGKGKLASNIDEKQFHTNLGHQSALSSLIIEPVNDDFISNSVWLYENPPYFLGLFWRNGTFHTFSMRLLQFGDLLINNILTNFYLHANPSLVVNLCIQSMDQVFGRQNYSNLLNFIPNQSAVTLMPGISRRRLTSLIFHLPLELLISGGALSVFFAQLTLFPAKISQDKALRMHYLMGARPLCYWIAMFSFDLIIFFLHITIFIAPMAFIVNFQSLIFVYPACIFAFFSFAPVIYAYSVWVAHGPTAFSSVLLFCGFLCLLPSCLPLVASHYGERANNFVDLLLYGSFFCPPLAATIISGLAPKLHNIYNSLSLVLDMLHPLLIICIFHSWSWLVLFMTNSDVCLRLYASVCGLLKKQYYGEPISENEADNVVIPINPVDERLIATGIKKVSEVVTVNPPDSNRKVLSRADVMTAISIGKLSAEAQPSKTSLKAVEQLSNMRKTNRDIKSMGIWTAKDKNRIQKDALITWKAVPTEQYRDQNINMSLFSGQCVNLYGDLPKTRSYLLDLAAGQVFPSAGSVLHHKSPAGTSQTIGYIANEDRLALFLTGRETLTIAAQLRGYKNPNTIVDFLLCLVDLERIALDTVLTYTIAERRMLSLAIAIVDKPFAIIIDEPSMYLEPSKTDLMWTIVNGLRDEAGTPVVFSTPLVRESETVSSHVAMIFKGAISLLDTTLETKKRYGGILILNVALRPHMKKEITSAVIQSQVENCYAHPHPNPEKLSFLITAQDGNYMETFIKVQNLMANVGIEDYQLEFPDLDLIYSANYTSLVESY